MRASLRFTLLAIALVAPALVLLAACNKAIDDPSTSENQVTVAAVQPDTACVDVDGTLQQGSTAGITYQDAIQKLTFDSRVRGTTDAGSVWSDVIFTSIDVSYEMLDGGATPAPWVARPVSITVPANGTKTATLVTVPVAYIGPGLPLETPGRLGVITMVFHGTDAANQPYSTSVRIPLGTYTQCLTTSGS
jgi:hypothetical protein